MSVKNDVKVQCPFKKRNYRCEYGRLCTRMEAEGKTKFNECPVAIRHREGSPWRDEK